VQQADSGSFQVGDGVVLEVDVVPAAVDGAVATRVDAGVA
jgi:hypothetical protein